MTAYRALAFDALCGKI